MLMPSKHIPLSDTYLGIGAVILSQLKKDMTREALWARVRGKPTVGTLDRFLYSLDLLFMFGLVEYDDGLIKRVQR